MNLPPRLRSFAAAAAAAILVLAVFVEPAFVGTAKAQPKNLVNPAGGGMPVVVTGDLNDASGDIYDNILTQITRAGVVAFFNAAQTFFGQLAYDAANYIASGGKGQAALVYEKGFGAYMEQVAGDAAGEFIGSLSDDSFFEDIGFDLCRPPSGENLLNIQLSLGNFFGGSQGRFQRPRPRCDLQQIAQNYENLYTTLSNAEVSDLVNFSFSPGGSELGVTASILGRSIGKISSDIGKKRSDREETGGFKAVEGIISGNVKTPASVVQREIESGLIEQPKADQGQQRNIILQNAFEEGPIQLAIYTASVFLNTLGSKLMQTVFERGLVGQLSAIDVTVVPGVDAVSVVGKTDARKANVNLKNVSLIRTSDIEIVSELIACPPDNRGLWNCTVDQPLGQAIQTKGDQGSFTVKEAIAKNLLHGDWRLLPTTFARENQDPQCYTYAYCSGNLAKLRAMRILPVGFEFAANSDTNLSRCATAGGCVTLAEVVDGYADCNAAGEPDATHPWCKLIDPNWVITSFPQQCQLSGYGENLLSNRLSQRSQECRDIQTCLQRNDQGECVGGYGYCMAERTTYRFNADECPATYASCRTFQARNGQAVSYLRNTLDYSVCSAENVGCLGYATVRRPDETWVTAATSTRYFDSTLQTCPGSEEGCTRLIAAEVGQSSLNLVQNPSFERVAGAPPNAASWFFAGEPITTTPDGAPSAFGTASLPVAVGSSPNQRIAVTPGNLYVVSFYARSSAGTSRARVSVPLLTNAGVIIPNADMSLDFRSSGCYTAGGNNTPRVDTPDLGTTWQRFECTFLANANARQASVVLQAASGNVLFDAVQVEEGQFATDFVDGINPSLPQVHMKVAPDDLQCGLGATGSSCAKFAQVCRQVDAGCQGYTDVAGGPEVPAVLSANDLCPNSCVGYAEYRKAPSSFDLVNDADERFSDPTDATSSYFIATTGQACEQVDVGCELFTNVEAAAAGGEQTRAFNYVRSCQQPDANSRTYFTWEGSDTSGFQLRTWSLISESGATSGPRTLVKRSPDGTVKEPSTCNEGSWRTGIDPDCRQFYDSVGDVYYRYYSQTILSTTQCTAWRLGRSNANDCRKTGGAFNAGTGECVYNVYVPESSSCRAQFAGCRAFTGAGSGNVIIALRHDFRSGVAPFVGGTQSSESLLVGDSSLRIDPAGGRVETFVAYPSDPEALYQVSFWAKAPARVDAVATLSVTDALVAGAPTTPIGSVTLGADWQRFTVGLFLSPNTSSTRLTWTFSTPGGALPIVFLDEVMINRVQDVAYVVNNSWSTPVECDRSAAGAPEPQAMLGCRAYRDRFGNEVSAYRFTSLCRAEAIGCRGFVDTRNSDATGEETFAVSDSLPVPRFNTSTDIYPGATTTREADRMVYLIFDRSKVCQAENASCRAFGKPNYAPDRLSIESYDTVFYKDDIRQYAGGLCRPSEEFCEEYSFGGAKDYFRDPQNHICEFREGVRLSRANFPGDPILSLLPAEEVVYSGWFRAGSDYPCYPSNLEGGTFFNISRRGDANYVGWVGLCPGSAAECTEFRDPNDTSDPVYRQSGKPYYFVNNSRIDTRTCQGNVDVGTGCILLRDMSNTALTYSVAASYRRYEQNDFQPTPPVDCLSNPSDPNCVAVNSTSSDANMIVRVDVDRDCAQWLGCQSAETVFDPATNRYKEVCTDLALCSKASGRPGDIFCSNYVDRSSTTTEPVLTRGAYFNQNRYTSRDVGLGALDYSGMSLPNTFQVLDLKSTRVGAEGALNVADNRYRFALDYRLSAAIPFPTRVSEGVVIVPTTGLGPDNVVPIDSSPVAIANPDLRLCQHIGTGIIGYYRQSDLRRDSSGRYIPAAQSGTRIYCYLPVHANSDAYDFQNVSTKFGIEDPRTDATLTDAFPPPECRAHPESDSPFPASYVTNWDTTKNPPQATDKLEGFKSANTCEYGEDCVCGYKRADFGAAGSKFYGSLSQNVPPGICVGGPRAGQACLPSSIFSIRADATANVAAAGVAGANASQNCGPPESGGLCVAFSKLELIRGIFGQCLERDQTRFFGGDPSNRPCLTWNPTPILFGSKDVYHYQPTSGYLPPQNSGQYYCVSSAKAPNSVKLDQRMFRRYERGVEEPIDNEPRQLASFSGEITAGFSNLDPIDFFTFGLDFVSAKDQYENQFHDSTRKYAGRMTRLEFDEQWISPDNRCAPDECDFRTPSLLGVSAQVSRFPSALDCENADDHQSYDGRKNFQPEALRLVDAGAGYTETFFRIYDQRLANAFSSSSPGASFSPEELDQLLSDNAISYLKITPMDNGKRGRIACGYQAAWVDNMGPISYGDPGSIEQADQRWREEFFRNYNPYITQGNEAVLIASGGRPARFDCVDQPTGNEQCYFKTWETGYRNENATKKWVGLGTNPGEIRSFQDLLVDPFVSTCEGNKPYFGIRAVFQSLASTSTTALPVESPEDITGSWRFVGLWVSACGGDTGGDQRYIYMNAEIGSASICREIAETKSAFSNTDAAFTDRIWSRSGYVDPGTGLQYGDRSAPFSSALNTGPAGEDPLFQAGFEITGFSPLEPPIFLQAGVQSYFRNRLPPKDKWTFLSNLFGRIYRVYRFHDKAVLQGDTACLVGALKGMKCNPASPRPECALDGVCTQGLFSQADRRTVQGCGPTSVSRGVPCGEDASVCKAPSFVRADGSIVSMRVECELASGWGSTTVGGETLYTNGGSSYSLSQARAANAFQCADGSVAGDDVPGSCKTPTPGRVSDECPMRLETGLGEGGSCVNATISTEGVTRRFKACRYDSAHQDLIADNTGIPRSSIFDSGGATRIDGRYVTCQTFRDCIFRDENYSGGDNVRSVCGETPTGIYGRCLGGVNFEQICSLGAVSGVGTCLSTASPAEKAAAAGSCDPVSSGAGNAPVAECRFPGEAPTEDPSTDPDTDRNICTHSQGYYPRLDICPDPSDEYCGLISYRLGDTDGADSTQNSISPTSSYPLPTDVTMGHYTPLFLGLSGSAYNAGSFSFMAYYTPRPPRIAAPDTRNCPTPGSCPIQRMDMFSFNGQADGPINVGGGLHKSTLRFYAWASANQMPLRQVVIDWGDNSVQRIDDTRMKNRKPFCGVQKECSDPIRGAGLTCQTDADCPAGTGRCVPLGTCANRPQVYCSQDSDCATTRVEPDGSTVPVADRCQVRTLFGNSPEACEANYLDFAHSYRCGAAERATLPDCRGTGAPYIPPGQCYFGPTVDGFIVGTVFDYTRPTCSVAADCNAALVAAGEDPVASPSCGPPPGIGASPPARCSRDPGRTCPTPGSTAGCAPGDVCIDGLSPIGGCFDAATNACSFTPRVMVQDNWGWCTGECRSSTTGGQPDDPTTARIRHPYGGCYSGEALSGERVRFNTQSGVGAAGVVIENDLYLTGEAKSECAEDKPGTLGASRNQRPWIVYPGSLQLQAGQ